MSQLTSDAKAFFGIFSNLVGGHISLSQAGTQFDQLGQTIAGQAKSDIASAEKLLGPAAAAEINAGLAVVQQGAATVLTVLDADASPYFTAGAKAIEGAVDTVMDAVIPGGALLNTPVNGYIDSLAAGLHAAVDSQVAAWKAKLAAKAA